MAIGFRAAGAAVSRDIGASGNPVAVPTPVGFAAGDYLVMCLLQDSNTNETNPTGWTKICIADPGNSGLFGYASPRLTVYGKVATGSEGSAVNVTYSTANWPTGNPYVVGLMAAYTGVNQTSPVDLYATRALIGPQAAAQTHPQANTSAGDWLLTIRGASSGTTYTCTDSVGTDVQRQIATGLSELTLALFDSNSATTAGLQTQRTTTTSGAPNQGTSMVTLALFPASAAGTTTTAQTANVSVSAPAASGVPAELPWSAVCGTATLPVYTWAVDWALSGMQSPGKIINTNAFLDTGDLTGWTNTNSTMTYVRTALGLRTLPTAHVVPNGGLNGGGGSQVTAVGTITGGQKYTVDGWVYCPAGWTDLRAVIDWYDSSNTYISTSGLSSGGTVAASVWTHLVQTFTAPSNAAAADVRIRYGSTPPVSTDYYIWGLILADPSRTEARIVPDATAIIQADVLDPGITFGYGRDQHRQLTPAALGTGSFTLTNKDRVYSPEYSAGPLFGTLDSARPVRGQVVYGGTPYNLFAGYLNDFNITVARSDRSVSFSVQDSMSISQQTELTTRLYRGIRTGDAIKVILSAIGWTGPTDIDPGSTIMPFWWLNGTKVPDAINDIVLSEGPPSIAYTAPDGTFVFRDRAHRVLRTQSTTVQASFQAGDLGVCSTPAPSGGTSFSGSEPFTYAHGWRDIINAVSFSVTPRTANSTLTTVWSSTASIVLSLGQSVVVNASASDPFLGAVVPSAAAGDFTQTGAGTVQVSLNRTSGQTVQITLLAIGGSVTVSNLRLRALSCPAAPTLTVAQTDSTSITQHGQQNYPNQVPWAGAEDALAIAEIILLRYAQRRPVVEFTVANQDPAHYLHILGRTISDLVNVEYDEMGLNSQFYVEYVSHKIQRMNPAGQPPVHQVTLSCEAQVNQLSAPPFTFDVRGAGFDNGVFSPVVGDSPSTVWIWDTQSVFDVAEFAT